MVQIIGESPSIQVELCGSMAGQRWLLEWNACMRSHSLVSAEGFGYKTLWS